MEEADGHDAANTALLLDQEIDKRVAEALGRIFGLGYTPHYDPPSALSSLALEIVPSIAAGIMVNPDFRREVELIANAQINAQIGGSGETQDLVGQAAFQAVHASQPFRALIEEIALGAVSDSIEELRDRIDEEEDHG